MDSSLHSSPIASLWRHGFLLLLTTFTAVSCSDQQAPEAVADAPGAITTTPLVAWQRPIWGASRADFNNDGFTDIFLGGHDGNNQEQPDTIYYGSASGFKQSAFGFPHGKDRHHCAALDVNEDEYPDLYCTVGVGRGTKTNANELWMNLDGIRFKRHVEPFGAEEATARGRLATALNFDRKDGMDLFTTVEGERVDGLRNDGSVFRNTGGVFEFADTMITGTIGGRCLAVGDLNRDGYDDLAVCNEKAGGQILLNTGNGDFTETTIHPGFKHWADIQIADVNGDAIEDIVLLGVKGAKVKKTLEVWYGVGDGSFSQKADHALSCDSAANPSAPPVYCAHIAVTDMNNDGYDDIYVARRLGAGKEALDGDIEDLIFFGPDYTAVASVPLSQSGMGNEVMAIGDRIVRINAGPRWPGAIDIVSVGPGTAH